MMSLRWPELEAAYMSDMKFSVGETVQENLKDSVSPPPESWKPEQENSVTVTCERQKNKEWFQSWALNSRLQDRWIASLDCSAAASCVGNYW